MDWKEEVLDALLQMYKDIIENITMPTGQTIMPAFFFSSGILGLSVVFTLFDLGPIPALVDWRGALISTLALGILVFIERRGLSEVSRLYRVAATRVRTAAQKRAHTNPGDEDEGVVDACYTVPAENGAPVGQDDSG